MAADVESELGSMENISWSSYSPRFLSSSSTSYMEVRVADKRARSWTCSVWKSNEEVIGMFPILRDKFRLTTQPQSRVSRFPGTFEFGGAAV